MNSVSTLAHPFVASDEPVQSPHTCKQRIHTMLGPVRPTRYDLAFSLFGIPVRVVPTFWLLAAILGRDLLNDPQQGFALILIWIAVVFVSVLVHELGHALTATLFGYPPRIMLYHFGGMAMYEPDRDYTAGKAILVTLAGPGAGLALFAVALVAAIVSGFSFFDPESLLAHALSMLLMVNLFWSILNLFPVLPLDGGQICREICTSISPHQGILWALRISIGVALLTGVGLLAIRQMLAGIMFLILAAQSYQEHEHRKMW